MVETECTRNEFGIACTPTYVFNWVILVLAQLVGRWDSKSYIITQISDIHLSPNTAVLPCNDPTFIL